MKFVKVFFHEINLPWGITVVVHVGSVQCIMAPKRQLTGCTLVPYTGLVGGGLPTRYHNCTRAHSPLMVVQQPRNLGSYSNLPLHVALSLQFTNCSTNCQLLYSLVTSCCMVFVSIPPPTSCRHTCHLLASHHTQPGAHEPPKAAKERVTSVPYKYKLITYFRVLK